MLQVLSGQYVDATTVLSDGSNLLHAAVDAADCSAEHVSVLLEAMRQRLSLRTSLVTMGLVTFPRT